MLDHANISSRFCYYSALLILLLTVFIVYSNSLTASWHLDDYANITHNPRLKIRDLQPQTLIKTMFADPVHRGKPYRSLPFLTFALNWHLLRNSVAGYHVVNILIHMLTAFILSTTVLNLFQTPNLKDKYPGNQYFIAFFTAALWALNPIQTQAVTYIVQRMASMAAMFYLLSLYFYLKARIGTSSGNKAGLFLMCFISFVSAIFSKENAALLPMALLLVEAIFFQDLGRRKTKFIFIWITVGGVLMVIVLGALLFGNPFGFLQGYPSRIFTPVQRLLTEPRVIIYYLSQLFYPVPTRLSIAHDVVVSTSIVKPWTTLTSIILLLLLLFIGLYRIKKQPILSFAILFFLMNHLVESTAIGLELVFEHRNYLPSLFLFLPVAVCMRWLLDHYASRRPAMASVLRFFAVMLLIGLGAGTYIRNMAWATEKTLWEDAMAKAPNSSRPLHQLAYQYYEKAGQYETALKLYHEALELSVENVDQRALRFNNIASIHFTRKEYALAEKYWKDAIRSYPKFYRGYYRLSLTLIRLGRWEEAGRVLDRISNQVSKNAEYSNLKGMLLLKENQPAQAVPYFTTSLQLEPTAWKAALHLGVAYDMLARYEEGNRYLGLANSLRPNEPLILLCLAQNSLQRKDSDTAGRIVAQYLVSVDKNRGLKYFATVKKNHSYIPISHDLLQPLIAEKISEKPNREKVQTSQLKPHE